MDNFFEMDSLKYLKINYDGKEIVYDQFTKYVESDVEIKEYFEKNTFIYRDREYTWDSYNEDLKEYSDKFLKDKNDIKYLEECDFVYLEDKDIYRSLEFLNAFNNSISAAFYYANKAYEKLRREEKLESYGLIYLFRSYDFCSSILWYSNSLDYLYHCFYSRFNLYLNEEFSDLLRETKYSKFDKIEYKDVKAKEIDESKFENWKKEFKECKDFLKNDLLEYNNCIKHRGGFQLENLNLYHYMKIEDSNNQDNIKYFDLPKLDIDEKCDLLVDSHNCLVELYNFMLSDINNDLNT